MADGLVGVGDRDEAKSTHRSFRFFRWQLREWAPAASWVAAFLVALPVAAHFLRHEGGPANIIFGTGVTMTLAAIVAIVTRRVLFATVLAAALVAIIVAAATFKRQAMEMVVHAYDLFFYFTSWSTISYLWSDHRPYVLGLLAAVLISTVLCFLAYRLDGTRPARRQAAVAAAVFAIVAGGAGAIKGERRHTQFYWEDLFVTSFYSSWSETIETLWRGQLIEALQGPHMGRALVIPSSCDVAQKPPHIVLIHQESVVQPSLFPGLGYDHAIDPLFRSFDGRLHKMRVETYGGASWLTEFSILAGVSTQSFGGMRQFVQSLMAGKVRDTLPEALQRCGYRSVVFYPMLRNFVSNAKFYTAIGMSEIFDLKDQGAKTANERDRFYYANALDEMGRHFGNSDRPLFTYIQTMSAHSPYNYVYQPDIDVPGGAPGTDPQLNEYLRRLSMVHLDYNWLRAEMQRRFPGERILVVHYGDHQPIATRTLLGYGHHDDPEDMTIKTDGPGYTTYFAVDGQNWQPPPLPDVEVLDVPYLGGVILEAAGLPLSDSYRERKRLLQVCGGKYFGCSKRNEVLGFHRRLIDSGLLEAR
jgi:phosphoglycerol transferase MdoB-like AlkP superfamily enzyme